jgi:exodeoxyribonuclease VII large subunit
MSRPVKSQWEFGELFPVEPTRKVLTVSELTWDIRRLLEREASHVWVSGEITNLKAQNSGHIYFSLKDVGATLSCVLFRGETQVDRSLLQDGQRVVLGGGITVYEARGQYQMRVTAVELQGLGALQAAFEKLKARLKAEGLFASERKRPLPRYPRRIGLVTSPTGAAIRDVLHVVGRRNPSLEIVLAACRVQGDGAAAEIARAIRLLNDYHSRSPESALDLILVTRGGGSLEDLWAFNEEIVARAIYESALPVVSAVGHEIDFTISDFVADVRAATPSAAAEIITEGVFSSCQFLSEASDRLKQLARDHLLSKQAIAREAQKRLLRLHPRQRLEDRLQRLDDLQTSLQRCARSAVRRQSVAWMNVAARLSRVRPALILKQRRALLDQIGRRLIEHARHRLSDARNRLGPLEARLRLLGPEQVLARGYSITLDAETGRVLRDAKTVKPGQRIRTRLHKGDLRSRVEP